MENRSVSPFLISLAALDSFPPGEAIALRASAPNSNMSVCLLKPITLIPICIFAESGRYVRSIIPVIPGIREEYTMNQRELQHNGQLYWPNDSTILEEQFLCLERLYDYNATRPLEQEKRAELLRQMFAEIGENCYIEPPFYSNWGGHHVHFGDGVYANFGLTCVDDTHIYVGSHTMFAPHVTLATAGHPIAPSLRRFGVQHNQPIHIGENCWLGAGVIVMPGVTIGDNTVIGAGSVVTKDIPAGYLAYGVPAKPIRPITEEDSKLWMYLDEDRPDK